MYLSRKYTNAQIMSVSGHKDERTFMDYVKLSLDEKAEELFKLSAHGMFWELWRGGHVKNSYKYVWVLFLFIPVLVDMCGQEKVCPNVTKSVVVVVELKQG